MMNALSLEFREDNSVADFHSFIITFWIFLTTVGDWEYLGKFPMDFIFFVRAKMGDSYEIWRETGQLASWCTSIYCFLSIWFTDSLNICKILFYRFPSLLLSLLRYWWECRKSMKTKFDKYSMNLWIKSKENYKWKCSKRPVGKFLAKFCSRHPILVVQKK